MRQSCLRPASRTAPEPEGNQHGNDSLVYTAVGNDSLIAVLWHISCFSNCFLLA